MNYAMKARLQASPGPGAVPRVAVLISIPAPLFTSVQNILERVRTLFPPNSGIEVKLYRGKQ